MGNIAFRRTYGGTVEEMRQAMLTVHFRNRELEAQNTRLQAALEEARELIQEFRDASAASYTVESATAARAHFGDRLNRIDAFLAKGGSDAL